ncbi:MAG: LytR/AlgR family response regulator transcription factor, partial [Bacteroidota bacterium]
VRLGALTEKINEQVTEKPVSELSYIFFKADKKIYKFLFSEILLIEGSGNYVKIHTQKEKPLLVLDKLSELQEKLPKNLFIRVHKSCIINIVHVTKKEGNMITIKDFIIPISSTFKNELDGLIKENG